VIGTVVEVRSRSRESASEHVALDHVARIKLPMDVGGYRVRSSVRVGEVVVRPLDGVVHADD